jgi:trypsin-like peptidase
VITFNVLERIFRVAHGDSEATAFTIDVEGRQYLITASHVVPDLAGAAQLRVFHEARWKTMAVSLVGRSDGDVDAVVLAPAIQISPAYELPPTVGGMVLGQDLYFLGFPYGLHTEMGTFMRGFPSPLVKRAVLSSIVTQPDGTQLVLLDGHNNPGFSGGPVVFVPHGKRPIEFAVAGVVSGYRFDEEPVYENGRPSGLTHRSNTGIVIAYSIKHALDLISANPIGVQVKATS